MKGNRIKGFEFTVTTEWWKMTVYLFEYSRAAKIAAQERRNLSLWHDKDR